MHYITLPYRTADDYNRAMRRLGSLQNRYNHVRVVRADSYSITIEYRQ